MTKRIQFFADLADDLTTAETARRGTRRTLNVIDALNEGDIYVVHTNEFAQYVRKYCHENQLNIIILVAADERHLQHVLMTQTQGLPGQIILDHELLRIILLDKVAGFEKMVDIYRVKNQPFKGEAKC